jgi:hypothetical protein
MFLVDLPNKPDSTVPARKLVQEVIRLEGVCRWTTVERTGRIVRHD